MKLLEQQKMWHSYGFNSQTSKKVASVKQKKIPDCFYKESKAFHKLKKNKFLIDLELMLW